PGWRGEVIGYETVSGAPQVAWSASTIAFDYRIKGKYAGKYFQPADSGVDPPGCTGAPSPTCTTYSYPDRSNDWKKRNVWTSNGTTMVKIVVDQTTGAITNATTLAGLGLGANATEADRVARWMLGDPSLGNPAVLGAIINSTPIDVGPPGLSHLPGG